MSLLILDDPQLIQRYEQNRKMRAAAEHIPAQAQVFFATDSCELDVASRKLLTTHACYLSANPHRKLQVHGHADRTGKPAHNLILSRQRAEAVISYLQDNGADKRQIASFAWGHADPLRQTADHEQNRRVELIYLL
jgi:peptidoglycan-associated lipoprotein